MRRAAVARPLRTKPREGSRAQSRSNSNGVKARPQAAQDRTNPPQTDLPDSSPQTA
eukprot:m.3753 g.3753  ORF g.3753 m.3753 type:complete len:56 (-) comp2095_c0_seq1:150-317(-)